MDENMFIALIAALVNLILSIIVPCALKNNQNFLPQVRIMLEANKHALLTSSAIVFVIVYISLSIAPEIKSDIPDSVLKLVNLSR